MRSLTRRDFVRTGALAGLAALSLPAQAQAAGDRPNLLFVFPDQFRAFALGFMGADPVRTPHLDAFARESVVFANAVSNLPICTPYRGMLMTGRWPFQTGIYTNTNSGRTDIFLDPSEVCLPDVLADQGYDCGYIGKYHLDAPVAEDAKYGEGRRGDGRVWDAYTPPGPRRHGFSFWHSYGCCDRHLKPHYWEGNAPREQPTEYDQWSVTHETDVAIEFVRRKRDRPFALFVAHNPPHPPYQQVPDTYRKDFQDKTPAELFRRPNVPAGPASARARRSVADYFSAVEGVDANFGRLLHALAETGQDRNTLVVFTSDHGEMMGSHGRMGKGVFQEESLRIPLIMRLPGRLKPRQDRLHINVPDMFPTLLGLLGMGEGVPAKVAGTNHAKLVLTGQGRGPKSSFFIGAAGRDPNRGVRAVRTDRYTFAVSRQGMVKAMLFDREKDPYQQHDVADRNPALCQELLAELNGWLTRTDDPWPQQVWPLQSPDAFAVHREEGIVRLDFEPPGTAKEVVAPDGSDGKLISEGALAGSRSLLADSRRASGRWHEVLHVAGIAQPNRKYELSYRYRVVAAPEKAQFYVVVRSPSTQHRALRDFWREDDGKAGVRTVVFSTESAKDYQLLFGVENQGAVVWDDVVLRDLGPAGK
jgi:arylsulfatase A-like enzyme